MVQILRIIIAKSTLPNSALLRLNFPICVVEVYIMPFWVYFYVILLMDRKLSLASLLSGLELKREKGLACAEKKEISRISFWLVTSGERGEELCEWLFMSLFGKLSSGLSIYFYNVISNISDYSIYVRRGQSGESLMTYLPQAISSNDSMIGIKPDI